jgi:hypothetical protein
LEAACRRPRPQFEGIINILLKKACQYQRMWLSRPALDRKKYGAKIINKYYLVAIGELRRDLPGADELDSAQRANRKAKKPGFEALKRQLDPPG